MSFLRHIEACNAALDKSYLALVVEGKTVGWVSPEFSQHLTNYHDIFLFEKQQVVVHPQIKGFHPLSDAFERVAKGLAEKAIIPPLMNEPYPVTATSRESAVAVMDRVAAAYFGLRSFGQHLNGYVKDAEGNISIWIGRRARDRLIFPGALDNMVAGGLPYGVSLQENLLKECAEEAGMSAALALNAHAVSALSYNRMSSRGFRPDVLYCYDLELPNNFIPQNTDGEVEEFILMPIQDLMQRVKMHDDFKINCNLVIIDFLIRHGLITPEDDEYLALTHGLHQAHGLC